MPKRSGRAVICDLFSVMRIAHRAKGQACYSPKRVDGSSNETQKDNPCRAPRSEKSETLWNE
jgi:hypothetical protein